MTNPSIFIGSSSEGIEVARAVELHLQEDAEVTIWNEGVFGLTQGTLESLVAALPRFDFAILVLTPDDLVIRDEDARPAARDNVLLELGLCIGALGRERTSILYDRDQKPRIPSDLAGVGLCTFSRNRKDLNPLAALGPASTQIRNTIRTLGRIHRENEDSQLTLHYSLLRGPQEILSSLVGALRSVDLEKAVVHRVLPMEFTPELLGRDSALAREYQDLVGQIIKKGESDIGYWDKTIFGRALNAAAREKTVTAIRSLYAPCPDTSYIGIDETYNHIGFILLGHAPTGFPSDFLWQYGVVFFGDPESHRPTPIYGFSTRSHNFIEGVLHRWWRVLEETCQRRGQYWDARNFRDTPDTWNSILDEISRLISTAPRDV
jgi:hypothetical protein